MTLFQKIVAVLAAISLVGVVVLLALGQPVNILMGLAGPILALFLSFSNSTIEKKVVGLVSKKK